jgi:hypothetical protein
MDHAIDHCDHMLGHVHNQLAPWQFAIPQMHLTSAPDLHCGCPFPTK